LYDASVQDGKLTPSNETEALGFFSPEELGGLPLAGMSAEKQVNDWLSEIRSR